MSDIYIGIDPGKDGGIAVITEKEARVWPYSDEKLLEVAQEAQVYLPQAVHTCLEKVGAMPGQGVVSMFSFGRSAGFIEGVLRAFEISYQLVPPQTWKREFSLNKSKDKSIDVCKRLFPGVDLLATPKCRKPHDGMAEALLMAEYARRRL